MQIILILLKIIIIQTITIQITIIQIIITMGSPIIIMATGNQHYRRQVITSWAIRLIIILFQAIFTKITMKQAEIMNKNKPKIKNKKRELSQVWSVKN